MLPQLTRRICWRPSTMRADLALIWGGSEAWESNAWQDK